ncbi:biopolymer transporter ExbD [Telmatobacter sp. DSM 110680]|uniref:Biopolymer transporter ExbD n=1 Tax=Telmatobacter sp. DSM 110680 TaxID=3036704 RepID=A0AAU7DNP8_9BACT
MTANNGDIRGLASEINVTPMIDVLLVLLIIFMVIVPAVPRGEAARVPHSGLIGGPTPESVVLEVLRGDDDAIKFRINQQPVAQGELQSRLSAIYANRAQRVLFVKGDDQLSFTQIAEVIDIGHAAGVDQIGLMTPKVLTGQ